jgi:hypothetical protein
MTAQLMVKSTLLDLSARDAFDRWYGEDHMVQAASAFSPKRCWRAWSAIDPAIHYANYEFNNLDEITDMMASEAFQTLVSDFSSTWDGRVVRSRDISVTVQTT